MKHTHVLIVNKNGLVSACPSNELFRVGDFRTNPELFVTFNVRIHPSTYKHLFANRDNAYILHGALPDQTDKTRIYYRVEKDTLKRADI